MVSRLNLKRYHNEHCIEFVALLCLPIAVVCVALSLDKLHPMHIPLLWQQQAGQLLPWLCALSGS